MNKLSSVLFLVAVILAIAAVWYFGRDYVSTVRDLGTAKADLAAWENKYTTAVTAQKQSEETIAKLRQDQASLMAELEAWHQQYDAIDRKNTAAQRRIRALEAQNAEIRDILRSRVPDDLWRLLFPRPVQSAAGNAGGDAGQR